MEDNIISKWIFKYGNEIVRKNTEEKLEKIMKEQKTTLEEAAERYANDNHDSYSLNIAFEYGAEWQKERMYSEEEVNEIIAEVWNSCEDNETNETFSQVRKRILEQFKKK